MYSEFYICCLINPSSQNPIEQYIVYLTVYGCSRSDMGNCFAVETTGALDAYKNVCIQVAVFYICIANS